MYWLKYYIKKLFSSGYLILKETGYFYYLHEVKNNCVYLISVNC